MEQSLMGIREVFGDMPRWDSEVADDLFDDLPHWDVELTHDEIPTNQAGQEDRDALPYLDVIWDEEPIHELPQCDQSVLLEPAEDEDVEVHEAGCVPLPQAPRFGDSIMQRALVVQKEIVTVKSVLVTQRVVKDLQHLCVESRNAVTVLSLVQPWEAEEDGMHGGGLALVLCSVFLPQLLELQRPPSSVLLSAALYLRKRYTVVALDVVIFPLVLRKEGLIVPQCVKECMHSLYVSALCHRRLSGEEQEWKPVCMPQHHESVGTHLVWTESLFELFYSILSQDISFTPHTVDVLISVIKERASEFSRSLKFGNFLKNFVSKCWHQCKSQRVLLERAAERTNTFLTKAILAELQPWRNAFDPGSSNERASIANSIPLCWSAGQCRITCSLIFLLHCYYLDDGDHELQSEINSSVRMQWDPEIVKATAWRQAVFRGTGNVTTQGWNKRDPPYEAHSRSPRPQVLKASSSTRWTSKKIERRKRSGFAPSSSATTISRHGLLAGGHGSPYR